MAGADSCHRRRYAVNYPQYVQDCSRWIQSLFFHKIINICLPLADIIRNQTVSDFGLDVLALHGSSSHAPSRFPDLPIFTLSYLLTNMGMQWFSRQCSLLTVAGPFRFCTWFPFTRFSSALATAICNSRYYYSLFVIFLSRLIFVYYFSHCFILLSQEVHNFLLYCIYMMNRIVGVRST